jgi:4a-hydroxytetrahydrobiopterin dehydratase
MPMKPSSPGCKPVSRAKAKNATLLNLLATPGLGSLLCRRWIAGAGQLVLCVAGFVVFMVWFVKEMSQYYSLLNMNAPPPPPARPLWWIAATGMGIVIVSWLWSAVTSVSLLREAARSKLESLQNFAAPPMPKLDENQIMPVLAAVPHWTRQGDAIARTFQFKDFPAAVKFVNAVAVAAEQAWHHPDIDIRWNKVTLTLTTHDAGGLTDKDFALARQCDALAAKLQS